MTVAEAVHPFGSATGWPASAPVPGRGHRPSAQIPVARMPLIEEPVYLPHAHRRTVPSRLAFGRLPGVWPVRFGHCPGKQLRRLSSPLRCGPAPR